MKVSRYLDTGINLIILVFLSFLVHCQLLTTTAGTIASPNYPEEYPINLRLILFIEVPGALFLRICFDAFDVETNWDNLYYGVGDVDPGQSTGVLTGSSIPADIVITDNRVWFYLYTDEINDYDICGTTCIGFSLTWCASTGK